MVIAVTHDRYFLDNVAGWILELDRGEGIPWQGNYSSWLEQKSQTFEMEENRVQASQNPRTGIRMDTHGSQGRQAKGKGQVECLVDKLQNEESKEKKAARIVHPTWPQVGWCGYRHPGVSKAFGKPRSDRKFFSQYPKECCGRHHWTQRYG